MPVKKSSPQSQPAGTPMPRALRTRAVAPPPPPPRTRRTSEQVQADKAMKEKAKQEKIQLFHDTVDKTARLEAAMQKEDKENALAAHHPPPNLQKKIPRPQRPTEANPQSTVDPADDQNEESDQSNEDGDAYLPQADEMRLDDEDDELAAATTIAEAIPKGKGEVRMRVIAVRGEQSEGSDGHKRKPSTGLVTAPSSTKKAKKLDAGLRSDWNTPAPTHIQPDSRSISSVPAKSASSATHQVAVQATEEVETQNPDDEIMGGISDNDGEHAERQGLNEDEDKKPAQLKGALGQKIPTLARVIPTESVPDFVSPRSIKRARRHKFSMKRGQVRMYHLPNHPQRFWESKFAPRLFEYFGRLRPWIKLDNDTEISTIRNLWAEVFPTEARMEDNEELEFIVLKLVDDAFGNWRHAFSSRASEYLKDSLFSDTTTFTTKEDRASWAVWSLGSDFPAEEWHTRRFYYREYEEPAEAGQAPKMKGIFQSTIVSETLAAHYALIKRLPSRDAENPAGALCTAVQACYHNINKWTTGDRVELGGKLGYFSAENWKDHDEVKMGTKVHIRSTSNLMDLIGSLNDKQWKRIIGTALSAQKAAALDTPATNAPEVECPKKVIVVLDDDSDSEGGEDSSERD